MVPVQSADEMSGDMPKQWYLMAWERDWLFHVSAQNVPFSPAFVEPDSRKCTTEVSDQISLKYFIFGDSITVQPLTARKNKQLLAREP